MNIKIKLFSLGVFALLSSCGKHYLDLKADHRQRVPQKLSDYQSMLDHTPTMNDMSSSNLALLGADEYYVTATQYNLLTNSSTDNFQKNGYIWAKDIYVGRESAQIDWTAGYNQILIANLALEGVDIIGRNAENETESDLLKGTALFFRALNYFRLAQLYAPPYNASTASTDLGLPLRTISDPTVKIPRSSLEETYKLILSDLHAAETLLPELPQVLFRPGKAALYALLTRVYMQLGDYKLALESADRSLAIQQTLTNFNSLTFTGNLTFPLNGANNVEVIFMSNAVSVAIIGNNFFNADSVLLNSYMEGDLRKNAYWIQRGVMTQFKGSYKGSALYFTGFATDEVYLNRAECLARENQPALALEDLNKLRLHRFTPATYVALSSTDAEQVLDWVIAERRLELIMRGTRWEDLRRLNKASRHATTLVRQIGTTRYELKPGDSRWTWPLPIEAIQNGGYTQNLR